jgi:glyoxylase-like metal-dependent hydrolase (beta-lactamase superfamily II)
MCFILEEENAMFTGDNVLGQSTTAVEHLGTWMETLRTMQSYKCIKGYPAHGDVIANLNSKITGELGGKLRRERQVLRALHQIESGPRGRRLSTKEVVMTVHGDKISDHLMENVLEPFIDEILRKLAEEGMVGFDMRGGVKKWFAVT